MRKIKSAICKIYRILNIIIKSIFFSKRVFIIGTPLHGNLGDQAIICAEINFLEDNFKDYKPIEIDSGLIKWFYKILKKIIKASDLILIHGGGFLGSLWINEEKMFRTVVNNFKENSIIVFPQTIYFSDDDEGEKILLESQRIYGGNKNLIICCREKYSYDFMKKNFPEIKVFLIPDMVLYLDSIEKNIDRNNVLFCIRKDKEKITYDFDKIKNYLKKENLDIDYTDTVINSSISPKHREKFLLKKFNQFSNYKLIITDRLHGMVFALLSNTPCIVFENKSYKIKGVYNWIKNISYIKLFNEIEDNFDNEIDKLLHMKQEDIEYSGIKNEYQELVDIIQKCIKDGDVK